MSEPSKPRDALLDKMGEHGPPVIHGRAARASSVERADAGWAVAAVEPMPSAGTKAEFAPEPPERPRPEIPPAPSPAIARLLRRLLRFACERASRPRPSRA
jgi:hypothetical protein